MYTARSTDALPPTQNPSSSTPITLIAICIGVGAFLILAVTMLYVQWAKRRNNTRSRLNVVRVASHASNIYVDEQEQETKTKLETTKPRSLFQEPLSPFPTDRKIKFELAEDLDGESTSTSALSALSALPEVSKPRPLRSTKGSSHSLLGARERYLVTMGAPRPLKVAHKPSTVSSVSMYSTASGEEHQVRVPPSLILAATEGLGIDTGSGYQRSMASTSNWTVAPQMASTGEGSPPRYSQASSLTGYTVLSEDSSGTPIGVAL